MGEKGLIDLIHGKIKNPDIFGAWSVIASCLPKRTVDSCYKLIKRKFNPDNYKGKWTPEEEKKLLELINFLLIKIGSMKLKVENGN